jgi:ElaB/YqjD/DUF883 family membrane-anchored ribosome-binding protein
MESVIENASTTDELPGSTADKLVSQLKTVIQRAEEKAVERAKAANRVVRENPYPAIGLAFGLGLLVGFLVRRK